MVFSSTVFLFAFLPSVLLLYYLCPRQLRNGILLLASLVFYSWGEPVYILVMLFSTVFDYINGLLIERALVQGRRGRARAVLICSVCGNLLILGFFKYGDFLVKNLNALLGTAITPLDLPLPIGISFYTFQTMSYTIDLYRGQGRAQRSLVDFGAFVALFPQLVAGPIVRYQNIEARLRFRRESPECFLQGAERFIRGLFKKLVFANSLGLMWERISAAEPISLSAGTAWLGALAFSLQIYYDFSGYSDMAIGLGKMFGFDFPENFDHPYRAKSASEFWRRWHMSLGTWFREYVYIPLGGSRRGRGRTALNLMIVWSLTGLWHGASWNFLVWGLYFGLLILGEKLFFQRLLDRLPAALGHFYGLFAAVLGWVIFAFEDMGRGAEYLLAMFSGPLFGADTGYYLRTGLPLLLFCALLSLGLSERLRRRLDGAEESGLLFSARLLLGGGMFFVSLCFLIGASYNTFLYFRF